MSLFSQASQRELIEKIRQVIPDKQEIYLVGGAVRDALLSRAVHDLDFVLGADPRAVARQVAHAVGGAYYLMDEQRLTARVVLKQPDQSDNTLDFARMRGEDLQQDLAARDFTIDAMAVPLSDLDRLIDPLAGADDLRLKQLRACSEHSIEADPLRILRGVRLALEFALKITPDTYQQMKAGVSLIKRVSSERQRDEMFRIFEGEHPGPALRILDQLGVISILFPELEKLKGVEQSPPHTRDVWEHTLATVDQLQRIIEILSTPHQPEKAENLALGMLTGQLGRFREQIAQELSARLASARTVKGLLVLAAMYHDIAKPQTWQRGEHGRIHNYGHEQVGADVVVKVGKRLQLSNDEINWLKSMVRHHMRIHLLAHGGQAPSRKATYHFFRDTGPVGIEVVLLTLADTLATYGASLDVDVWEHHLLVARELLQCWWENPEESINPPVLLNGYDLQNELDLSPGPLIGKLLAAIREAQAEGMIRDRAEALSAARDWLADQSQIEDEDAHD